MCDTRQKSQWNAIEQWPIFNWEIKSNAKQKWFTLGAASIGAINATANRNVGCVIKLSHCLPRFWGHFWHLESWCVQRKSYKREADGSRRPYRNISWKFEIVIDSKEVLWLERRGVFFAVRSERTDVAGNVLCHINGVTDEWMYGFVNTRKSNQIKNGIEIFRCVRRKWFCLLAQQFNIFAIAPNSPMLASQWQSSSTHRE